MKCSILWMRRKRRWLKKQSWWVNLLKNEPLLGWWIFEGASWVFKKRSPPTSLQLSGPTCRWCRFFEPALRWIGCFGSIVLLHGPKNFKWCTSKCVRLSISSNHTNGREHCKCRPWTAKKLGKWFTIILHCYHWWDNSSGRVLQSIYKKYENENLEENNLMLDLICQL